VYGIRLSHGVVYSFWDEYLFTDATQASRNGKNCMICKSFDATDVTCSFLMGCQFIKFNLIKNDQMSLKLPKLLLQEI
jgi:hypothetical protein